MEKETLEVGMHLVLDGRSSDPEIIGDVDRIRKFLDEFPKYMGMTKVTPPYVFRYQGATSEESGISGIVIIAESHISVHTFPARRYVSVDIFSCKPFDVDEAVQGLVEYFRLVEFRRQVFDRGVEYPRDLFSSIPLVLEERLEMLGKMAHT
ncbi:S-adenosylmethionine decarboxylase [Candidatus Caldatribacterium sp. SIUC1]|uniref:S-adenosylmethionine decarboxylase n=1 Tax=Candidatus Caldatribacterium sp. SIUC1 TaxID=3418365 RepID=UPI003F690122